VGHAALGRPETRRADEGQLVFTSPRRGAINRSTFNTKAWQPAIVKAAGLEPTRATGMRAKAGLLLLLIGVGAVAGPQKLTGFALKLLELQFSATPHQSAGERVAGSRRRAG
jgi:hypothetical protein